MNDFLTGLIVGLAVCLVVSVALLSKGASEKKRAKEEVEKVALSHENSAKWLEGKTIRKVIVVPKKIVNIVLG